MLPVQLKKAIAAMPLPKQEKKNFSNCGNGIAENGKKNWMELWQCHCRKWEEKKNLLPKSGKKF